MRLADCCYRIENVQQGMKYLEALEVECLNIYTVSLLKGKYMDLVKDFSNAAIHFQKALDLYQNEPNKDKSVQGNI
jgi:hypothetical protein